MVRSDDSERGVYYIPQMGLGMEGLRADGSVCSIAHHIVSTPQYVSFKAVLVNPIEMEEDCIIKSIVAWMKHGDSEADLKEDEYDDDGVLIARPKIVEDISDVVDEEDTDDTEETEE